MNYQNKENMKKRKPDFIIVGAMKSATTDIANQLSSHSEIAMAPGEPSFFSRDDIYENGEEWYLEQLNLYVNEETRLVGEKTPGYSNRHTLSAERIHQMYPEVKLIWILRNPVDRAYSHFLHALKLSREGKRFESAIEEELKGNRPLKSGYIERSRYDLQVEHYLKYFPIESMYFMIFEDYKKDPISELDKLFKFLGVSGQNFQLQTKRSNPTIIPRCPYFLHTLSKILEQKNPLFKNIKRILRYKKSPGYPRLSESTRQLLQDELYDNIRNVEKIIGRPTGSLWF